MIPADPASLPRFEPEVQAAHQRQSQLMLIRGLRLWASTLLIAFLAGVLVGATVVA